MYEIVRIVPENERPKEAPIPPNPKCATVDAGTEEEWDAYWKARDAFYHGLELREI
jgi:hypothetical protein